MEKEADRWFASPDFTVDQVEMSDRDGGYFYGTKAKIRQFVLECYFENISIAEREKIRRWLGRDTSGKLIFDSRPFIYYNVRPTRVVDGKAWCHEDMAGTRRVYSGTFTITFSAYNPFGYMNYSSYHDVDYDGAGQYCDILSDNEMPPAVSAASGNYLLYNCGTEKTPIKILVSGVAPSGFEIKNKTNGTTCRIAGLPNGIPLMVDGETGAVATVAGDLNTIDFSYHDDGFIVLEPCRIIADHIIVSQGEQQNTVVVSGYESILGRGSLAGNYILLGGIWMKIIYEQEDGTLVLQGSVTLEKPAVSKVATMNELVISGENLE